MNNNKNYKVYYYHEEKEGNKIYFGWKVADNLPESDFYILSTHFDSPLSSEKDIAWSKLEGVTITPISEYLKWFKSTTGEIPSDFVSKWSNKIQELEANRTIKNRGYKPGEGEFLFHLALLLTQHSTFSKFSRTYKVIRMEDLIQDGKLSFS